VQLVQTLLAMGPSAMFLVGVLVLFKLLRQSEAEAKAEMKALVERYHTLVSEQVRTLTIIAEHLEEGEKK